MDHSTLSRRAAFGMFGATAALGGILSRAPAARADGHGTYDLSDPDTYTDAVIRMRASQDENVQFGYVKGMYWGVADAEIIPLCGLNAASIYQYKKRDDGSYFCSLAEVAYFTDFDTGAYIEEMTNPITGELIEIKPYRMGPSLTIITRNGRMPATENQLPGASVSNRYLPLRANGDDVDLTEEIRVKFPAPPGGEPFRYNEISTFRASLADLANPELESVRCHTHFNGVVTWRPWLKMPGHPGHMLGNAAGRQVDSADGFHSDYLEWTDKFAPDYLYEPEKVLKLNELVAAL